MTTRLATADDRVDRGKRIGGDRPYVGSSSGIPAPRTSGGCRDHPAIPSGAAGHGLLVTPPPDVCAAADTAS
ncbi:MAG: hypothetical protein M3Q65_21425, partial [Chloroflexota bacterium]|nr:hypothetical protein [Chloroflexota bacterium]